MAWDEDPERPGMAKITIDVSPPNRNALEQVSSLLTGEDSNPLAQVALIIVIILLLVAVAKRRSNSTQSKNWQRDGLDDDFDTEAQLQKSQAKRPTAPPPGFVFEQALQQAPSDLEQSEDISVDALLEGPPIPESGLPAGWTAEQWQYYGHEWLKGQ